MAEASPPSYGELFERKEDRMCSTCKVMPAARACQDCDNLLCGKCVRKHSMGHVVAMASKEDTRAEDAVQVDSNVKSPAEKLPCSEHPTKAVKYLCRECGVNLCELCLFDDEIKCHQSKGGIHQPERLGEGEGNRNENIAKAISREMESNCRDLQDQRVTPTAPPALGYTPGTSSSFPYHDSTSPLTRSSRVDKNMSDNVSVSAPYSLASRPSYHHVLLRKKNDYDTPTRECTLVRDNAYGFYNILEVIVSSGLYQIDCEVDGSPLQERRRLYKERRSAGIFLDLTDNRIYTAGSGSYRVYTVSDGNSVAQLNKVAITGANWVRGVCVSSLRLVAVVDSDFPRVTIHKKEDGTLVNVISAKISIRNIRNQARTHPGGESDDLRARIFYSPHYLAWSDDGKYLYVTDMGSSGQSARVMCLQVQHAYADPVLEWTTMLHEAWNVRLVQSLLYVTSAKEFKVNVLNPSDGGILRVIQCPGVPRGIAPQDAGGVIVFSYVSDSPSSQDTEAVGSS